MLFRLGMERFVRNRFSYRFTLFDYALGFGGEESLRKTLP